MRPRNVDLVQQVRSLCLELDRHPFLDGEPLGERRVDPGITGPAEVVARKRAVPDGVGQRKDRRANRSSHPFILIISACHIASREIGPVGALAIGVEVPSCTILGTRRGVEVRTGLEVPDCAELPAPQDSTDGVLAPAEERQFPKRVHLDVVRRQFVTRPVQFRTENFSGAAVVGPAVVVTVRSIQLPALGKALVRFQNQTAIDPSTCVHVSVDSAVVRVQPIQEPVHEIA